MGIGINRAKGIAMSGNTFQLDQLDIINQMPDPVVILNNEQKIIHWNTSAEEVFGYAAEKVLGDTLNFLYSPESRKIAEELLFNKMIHTGQISCHLMLLDKKKRTIPCKLNFSVMPSKDNQNNTYLAVFKEQIVSSNSPFSGSLDRQRLENLQEIARLGYWESDIINNELWLSSQLYEIYELNPSVKPHYRTLLDSAHPDDKNIVRSAIQQCMRDGYIGAHDYRILTKKGNIKFIQAHAVIKYQGSTPAAMAGTIQDITATKQAEIELEKYRNHLEELVEERAQEIERLDSKLLEISRKAGMSEVAGNILHNMGNVLNSVNTSCNISIEFIRQLQKNQSGNIVNLLREGNTKLFEFISGDDQGRQFLEYLEKLCETQASLHNRLNDELSSLDEKVVHLRHILDMQNTLTGVKSVREWVYPETILHKVVDLTNSGRNQEGKQDIRLDVHCLAENKVRVDQHGLIQILVNLITNAQESLQDSQIEEKKILIEVSEKDSELVFVIQDNGIGFPEGDSLKIFNAGYSSKKNGRGYGLHSCALLASDMNGLIEAQSMKPGEGAQFTLKIPLSQS